MNRNYTVRTKILRPVADVFDAVVSKDHLSQYFVDKASDDLREGATIRWRWNHYGENPVVVRSIEAPVKDRPRSRLRSVGQDKERSL